MEFSTVTLSRPFPTVLRGPFLLLTVSTFLLYVIELILQLHSVWSCDLAVTVFRLIGFRIYACNEMIVRIKHLHSQILLLYPCPVPVMENVFFLICRLPMPYTVGSHCNGADKFSRLLSDTGEPPYILPIRILPCSVPISFFRLN